MGEQKYPRSGFTRADLLVVVSCICFLAVVWIRPSLAGVAARNDEAVCANNLRHIGQGFAAWAQDHEESYGWWLSASSQASTKNVALNGPWHQNLWFQYFWISNELRSPRYLADPADDWQTLRIATNWNNQSGGFLHPSSKNAAVSYSLGLHASPLQPNSILSGDGNIRGTTPGLVHCSTGIDASDMRRGALWPEDGHGNRGNLLFSDGRVEMTDTARLQEAVLWNPLSDDVGNWNMHFLKPRNP